MKLKINSTINLNIEQIRELTELITKITAIQIKEITASWEKAKKIIREKSEEQSKDVTPK